MDPSRDPLADFDHRLHDHLVDAVLDHGPQRVEWLSRRARRQLRDARVDEQAVIAAIVPSTILVPRPDGRIDHALAVLEGNVLTHRVRAPTRDRVDLWLGCGVQPLLNIAAFRPIKLADGTGEVRRSEPGYDALVGPAGWLPAVERFELIGLRIVNRRLRVEVIDEDALPPPEAQLRVRRMLASIYTREHFLQDEQSLVTRPAELARAISLALLEDPELFASPYPPLDELLHNPLERELDLDHWRDVAVSQQVETVGFWLDGVPASLSFELNRRARQHGMTEQQLIVAMLSTLAWRTPFAEDMEPYPSWFPEGLDDKPRGELRSLDARSDPSELA
jgi:hypothetical protein